MNVPGTSVGQEWAQRKEVEEFQRARIVSAMVEVVAEVGYVGAAVAPVVAVAGVSRRTFYELFEGREDCFLAAFEWGVEQFRDALVTGYGSQRSWRNRVRHSLVALLGLLDSEPELSRVCVIEALGAGKLVLTRRAKLLQELISALEASAPQKRGGSDDLPLLTAEGVVGGAFSVIHGRLLERGISDRDSAGDGEAGAEDAEGAPALTPLLQLHGQLMALIALPYLGPRVAGEELTRAPPEPVQRRLAVSRAAGEISGPQEGDSGSLPTGGRLLERLDMRLTYRTVRCLVFIAEHPGSSNREIAQGAEIADEGQASKLLARLVKLDLIANSRPPGPGFPNRWALTPHGQQVLNAVRGS